ncbi:MAG: ribonuclease P protein subunit [Thaumarchaeota archaeon]|nr:ribonuclease P protein subunit [Nitrososphaerota archaeon]
MSIVGEHVTVVASTDPTKVGRAGKVLTESAKTFVIGFRDGKIRVEKKGAAFLVSGSGRMVNGDDVIGRPEERLGAK